MTTKTLANNPPSTNYQSGSNWIGGVAPVTGDSVIINSLPAGGPVPITATGVAISNQQIMLTSTGGFGAAGGSSFDALTTLTGTTDNSNASFDGNFVNAGTITDVSLAFTAGGGASPMFSNTGTIAYDRAPISNPAFSVASGSSTAIFANTGTINIVNQAGGQLTGGTAYPTFVTLGAPLSGSGVVNLTGDHPNSGATAYVGSEAKLSVNSGDPVSGTNTFNLNDGELVLGSIGTGTLNFLDATGILDFGSGVDVSTSLNINGFRAGDVIGLGTSTVRAGTLSYNAATSILSFQDSSNGNVVVSLHIIATGTQTYTTASFAEMTGVGDFTSSQSITTTAAAPCYCPGTMILTDHGEVAVEDLRIGDRLVTGGGRPEPIRWIGRRAYAGSFIEGRRDILPVRIRAGALGADTPRRDLVVSPMHAMFLDGVLVPAGALVNGVSITQAAAVESVHYIHLELAQHSVIWADGAASESFVDDNSRFMFHNAEEFAALYPGRQRIPAAYCAPRVEDGARLVAIQARIDVRAGLDLADLCQPLRGSVDNLDGAWLCGWAQNPAKPEVPVCLDVVADGVVVGRTLANLFRADLRAAGLGSGRHSFKVALPPGSGGLVEVRRAADGAIVGMIEAGQTGTLRHAA